MRLKEIIDEETDEQHDTRIARQNAEGSKYVKATLAAQKKERLAQAMANWKKRSTLGKTANSRP